MDGYRLQILVPQYKETEDIVKFLLDSIALQQGIPMDEIGVIIGNDGSDVRLSDEFLKSYPYNIDYYIFPHRGVSATRNSCLDKSTAEYVMFCDADDMFFSSLGIWLIFDEMKNEFDVLHSDFLTEERDRETGEIYYSVYDRDGVFVHGKVYRRQYLMEKEIRFNESLTICEDCNFVAQCQCFTDNFRYIAKSFYLWKWRDGSVSRENEKFNLRCQIQMIESNDDLLKKLLAHDMVEKARGYAIQMILNFYYTSTQSDFAERTDSEEYQAIAKGYSEWFKHYGHLWDSAEDDEIEFTLDQFYTEYTEINADIERRTIRRWVDNFRRKYC